MSGGPVSFGIIVVRTILWLHRASERFKQKTARKLHINLQQQYRTMYVKLSPQSVRIYQARLLNFTTLETLPHISDYGPLPRPRIKP